MNNDTHFRIGTSATWGIVVSISFVALVLAGMFLFDLDRQLVQLLAWLDAQGTWASLLFVLIMAAVVVLLLPGVLFTTGAGFVFGVVEGSLYVVLGTTLGATIAFLIARYLFGDRMGRFIQSQPRLKLINAELMPQGWKIVMLTRLVPFFPFKLSNYFFGLMRIPLRGFVGGTFVGIVPFSVHNVYLGSIAADITTLGTRGADRSSLEWGLYGVGFLITVILVVLLSRLATRALAKSVEPGRNGAPRCRG
jgi:uncharacterized membrane protein YdjX (TVP38/TMEM64 family)